MSTRLPTDLHRCHLLPYLVWPRIRIRQGWRPVSRALERNAAMHGIDNSHEDVCPDLRQPAHTTAEESHAEQVLKNAFAAYGRSEAGTLLAQAPEARPRRTRKQLMEAAVSLIGDFGIQGTTVSKISAGVGLSEMAAYRHFVSKEEILMEASSYLLGGSSVARLFEQPLHHQPVQGNRASVIWRCSPRTWRCTPLPTCSSLP